jgi:hypothetical protein
MSEGNKRLELKRFEFAIKHNLPYLLPEERSKPKIVDPKDVKKLLPKSKNGLSRKKALEMEYEEF